MIRRRHTHEIPELNTSSLPDLIFTVLFFFMIVTHMRKTTLKVHYQVPQGTELTKLTRKSAVTYLYIGHPISSTGSARDKGYKLQINDKYADVSSISDFVSNEKARMSPEDAQRMTVSIKADRHTPMGIITDVKQNLRKSGALRINYSAELSGSIK